MAVTHDVFLSYSARDKEVVRDLAVRLRDRGLRVWFDEWEILPGDPIPHRVEEGLECHTDWVRRVAYHPDGTQAISGGNDGTVRVWDLASGTCRQVQRRLQPRRHPGHQRRLGWHPAGGPTRPSR